MFNIEYNGDEFFDFKSKKIIKKINKAITKILNIKNKHYLSIAIVDNDTIKEINNKYRGINNATDVISFAYIDSSLIRVLPDDLGNIIISYEKVKSQANEYGHSELREFSFLVIHGILHLLGYDHQDKNSEHEMFELQNRILKFIGIER